MTPATGMPHPWWMFWQIGDFLVMAAVVTTFVLLVRRASRSRVGAERRQADAPARGSAPGRATADGDAAAATPRPLAEGERSRQDD